MHLLHPAFDGERASITLRFPFRCPNTAISLYAIVDASCQPPNKLVDEVGLASTKIVIAIFHHDKSMRWYPFIYELRVLQQNTHIGVPM
jgi:hypothetical protein